MRIVVAAWAAACLLPLTTPRQASADIVVHVNKSTQRMLVLVNGSERYNWLVSTGARRYVTPNGDYQPYRFHRFWWSRKYDAPMPHSIFFYEGYAIHGSKEIKMLGRIASHGCVRLHPANAKALFALVQDKTSGATRIVIADGPYVPPQPPPLLLQPPEPAQPPQSPPSQVDSVVSESGPSLPETSGSLESALLEITSDDANGSEAAELAEAPVGAAKLAHAESVATEIALRPLTEVVQPADIKSAPLSKPEKPAESLKAPVRTTRVPTRVAANGVGFHW
jgi:hypothetical protein